MFRILLIILFIQFPISLIQAQTPVQRDTTSVYKNIEKFSRKKKVTKLFHKIIFRSTDRVERKSSGNKKPTTDLKPYHNKKIRNIYYNSFDPFGQKLTDSTSNVRNWFEKTGNHIHVRTKRWTINDYLLVEKNTPLDSSKVRESERLIQSQRFIRDVSIVPVFVADSLNNEYIDLYVNTLDSWSLIPTGSISTSKLKLRITERNFAGLGHEFINQYRREFNRKQDAYIFQYRIPNFKKTFIETKIRYDIDFDKNYQKEFSLNRNFYSNYAKWAGGVQFLQTYRNDTIYNVQREKTFLKYKNWSYDLWGGFAFTIFKNKPELNKTTNFVITGRFQNTSYSDVPDFTYDQFKFYRDTKLYLTSFGITSREFTKSSYIFYHGINEYIESGRNIFVTTGLENRNNTNRYYLGGKLSKGEFYKYGYLNTTFEIGTFFNHGATEQNLIRLNAFFMSNIFNVKSWRFRQFVVPSFTIGGNRYPVWHDLTSLADKDNGIVGFTDELRGSKRFLLTLQTQSYMPKSYAGFRLSPFLNANIGSLGNTTKELFNSSYYGSIGIGVQISNDYLIFDNFQISFTFFPKIPFDGSNILKTNSLNNDDINLPTYQIGKPTIA
ncbi:MAG: hypothetical protein KBS98_08450, partial [Flavobacterium sp.]|nr:hypothetical protein [Candidatus Neoflavobacterium equi]